MAIRNSISTVQASTNDSTLVAGSAISTANGLSLSITAVNTGDESIDWIVYGANLSDLSDKVIIKESAEIISGGSDFYATYLAPFRIYCVFVNSAVEDTHGEITLSGLVKG